MLLTPVSYAVASALIEGLKSETVALNDHAVGLFPQGRPASFEEAVRLAPAEYARHSVVSRWCDSSGGAACDLDPRHEDFRLAVCRDIRVGPLQGSTAEAVFRSLKSLGGKNGGGVLRRARILSRLSASPKNKKG